MVVKAAVLSTDNLKSRSCGSSSTCTADPVVFDSNMRYYFSGIFSLDVNPDGKVEVLKFLYKVINCQPNQQTE